MFNKSLIGMVHVGALPGTPFHRTGLDELTRRAVEEAGILVDAGFDAIVIENMHDRPYVHGAAGPEIVASMTRIGRAVREATGDLPLGVQILSGANRDALAVAHATGASFIRCENFVFAHVGDEGLQPTAEAGSLLRYRAAIGADDIRVFCDIKKKHASHAITSDVGLDEMAHAVEFFAGDGVIVTGTSTGRPTPVEDVAVARSATSLPVLVGSGVAPDTVGALFQHADGLIVGSWIKRDGIWSNEVDPQRCKRLVEAR